MSEKVIFEQFILAVQQEYRGFVEDLHTRLLESGCKVNFEEKKNGFLASYKIGKPPRAFLNFLFRKRGMFVRIYGENASKYSDFLSTLPSEMLKNIEDSGVCKRLVHNTCSPKCAGYDFLIGDLHFRKCKYGCFEFLATEENIPHIKDFVQHELSTRGAV